MPYEIEIEEIGPSHDQGYSNESGHVHIDDDIVAYDEIPTEEVVIEAHDHDGEHSHDEHVGHEEEIESSEPGLPGCLDPEGDVLQVEDTAVEVEEENKKAPKNKWDWPNFPSLLAWMKTIMIPGKEGCPTYKRNEHEKLLRAISHVKKVIATAQNAIANDVDQDIDADPVMDEIRKLEKSLELMTDLESTHTNKKKTKKAASAAGLVSEGQKAAHVGGIIVTVPLLISRVARVCINGMVSAGHDIEVIFDKQAKQYDLSERECAEVMQLLSDMGYPLRRDRGYVLDEKAEPNKAADWATNFKG